MTFWTPIANWFAVVVARADWISVIAAFLATVLGSFIAAVIALRLQRNDFRKRAQETASQNELDRVQRRVDLDERKRELADQSEAEALRRRLDFRRTLVARAFGTVTEASIWARHPLGRNTEKVKSDTDGLRMLFATDDEAGSQVVGQWFWDRANRLLNLDVPPPERDETVRGLESQIHSALAQWATGAITSEDFRSR